MSRSWRRVAGVLGLALAACGATRDDLADDVLELPAGLREVSGIAVADADTLACVQDERGEIWFVDRRGATAPRAVRFGPKGDYEGLARVGDDYWVLRSDGWLGRIVARDGELHIVSSSVLPGGFREWEALCFDRERNRLLVMPKTAFGETKEAREQRPIYAVDPASGLAAAEPVLVLHRRELLSQAAAKGLPWPVKHGKRAAFEFACSEIAVVPASRDLLLLSAVDRVLLRVGPDGQLLAALPLDEARLPQPEGMAFLADGRLLIASEGRGGAARCVVMPVP